MIFAGGQGRRMGERFEARPKQFLLVNGKPILAHTLEIFQRHGSVDGIYLAVLADYMDYALEMAARYGLVKLRAVVAGGDTAQESIYNALCRAREDNPPDSVVLIHDGVRPVLADRVIDANIESVLRHGTAVTCTACQETILEAEDGLKVRHVPLRAHTFAAQAPQSFRLADVLAAHEAVRARPGGYAGLVDACTIYHVLGRPVRMVRGNRGNIKVTTPEDMYLLRAILQYRQDSRGLDIDGDLQIRKAGGDDRRGF
ncbi:MAG: 2-C-methyl-D-erythritol 4-phosphate cytidylyltransferase [Candidatus Adiutrix sp.]|nr:2-C-methyl-D-erythritol 4-phosphate cytidylyltransferase [Candidatus Adiutrix sp.]